MLDDNSKQILDKKKEALIKKRASLKKQLPHLFGFKWYRWARAYFESTNLMNLLCAANQISKSSTLIRKNIHWATATNMWPKLWPKSPHPRQFWYLYPTADVATTEFQTKWVPEFMPKRGQFISESFKEECRDPVYGWKANYEKKKIYSITFVSGVTLYFKAYSQNVHHLQSGTVHMISCFTAGHLVLTRGGLIPVECVKVGDYLWTRNGWNPVISALCQKKDVSTRVDGLESTDDHPFLTDRGWVEYKDLTENDTCGTVPQWKILEKLYYLKGRYSLASLNPLIRGLEIILGRLVASISMLQFGRATIVEMSLKGMSYTTRILTLLIMVLEILNCLLGVSTQESIKSKSGNPRKKSHFHVHIVGRILNHVLLRKLRIDIALKSAVKQFMSKIEYVHSVRQSITSEKTHQGRPVRLNAQSKRSVKDVYSIKVANTPEYITNGYYTHNCDEELPEDLYDELNFRRKAVGGYFNMVFTATRNQIMWLLAIEAKGEMETFKNAFKLQVSMYDCIEYEDGSPGHYSKEQIEEEIIPDCKNKTEIDRRVYGRFVTEIGRKYGSFDPTRHYVKPFEIPRDWRYYGGVDPGSGGAGGHPSGMGIIAVSPDYRRGVVCRGWRGDNVETTAGDTLSEYLNLRNGLPTTGGDDPDKYPHLQGSIDCQMQVYDWAAKDFYTIATRCGETFNKAEKSHEFGEEVVNTLFHNNMLQIFDTPELRKLGIELMTLKKDTHKKNAKDDFIDGALRYPSAVIPWDFTAIQGKKSDIEKEAERIKKRKILTPEQFQAEQIRIRRGEGRGYDDKDQGWRDFYDEIEMWNDQYGA